MKTFEITIKRNDGQVDKFQKQFPAMTESLKGQIVAANKNAGRGEVLNIADVTAAEPKKKSNINGLCPKCNTYCYGDCQAH